MKKLGVVFVMLLMTFSIYAQQINKDKNGVFLVVEVDLTKKEIYQKVNEWIAINYKSANDVIQLNTEDKVILKGNYLFQYQTFGEYERLIDFRLEHRLSISIKENKYKIDLIPLNSAYIDEELIKIHQFKNNTALVEPLYHIEMSKEDFDNPKLNPFVRVFIESTFYSEEDAIKYVADNPILFSYEGYRKNKRFFDLAINKYTFNSLKNYISNKSTDDDW